MNVAGPEMLARLGRGESISTVCGTVGISREAFDAWWQQECRRRVPPSAGEVRVAGIQSSVRITRDGRGLPHVMADRDRDLFFGFGYAVAQDRLFQLDYLRRKACGRLAEVLGPEAVESDRLYRTIDLAGIAAAEWSTLGGEIQELLAAYADGINAVREASRGCWPIEFDLLEYEPEPWSPQDSLAIIGEFRFYLTVRFPVIVVPELVKRAVGEGPLYRAFLAGEVDRECILPEGSYPRRAGAGLASGGANEQAASGAEGGGSNNWVLAGSRTDSGQPLLASDPHVPFAANSIWHEVHLRGGSFHVGGIALAGMPAILIGRNERMAWGITNNICSQRDLYQERTDPAHPDCFLFDGRWEPARRREEVIAVRHAAPIRHTVVSSRNGPLVDALLPPAARDTGPVSLRWLGAEPCGWLTAVLGMNRAGAAAEFRESLRPWRVPTFSVVFADVGGQIGYQCSGGIPQRWIVERGYRPGWDPAHQWDGCIPFENMPHLLDPRHGYLVTANNRVAHDDFAYPLSGTWVTGYRARRIREQLEAQPRMTRDAHRCLQLDVYSGRAAACVPQLLRAFDSDSSPRIQQVLRYWRSWDFHVHADSVAATLFNVFFVQWCRRIVKERLPAEAVELVTTMAGPLAVQLLPGDELGWFEGNDGHRTAVHAALRATLDELTQRLGPEMDRWEWGRLHVMLQKHVLAGRGDLGALLDQPRLPLSGDGHTVNSSGPDANHAAWIGATFRMVADLADPQHGWWSIESGSASGHPGSDRYADQLPAWRAGELYYTALQEAVSGPTLYLHPESVQSA